MSFIPERFRYYFANVFAACFVLAVVYSGFAYPLHYGSGFWPFNCDWFMFSYDTGYDFELEAWGKMQDGAWIKIDPQPYFSLAVGADSNRFQEVTRSQVQMKRLAKYLCQRFPAASITITEVSWIRRAGKRLHAADLPEQSKNTTPWVSDVPCGS